MENIRFYLKSDRGNIRPNNEDSLWPPNNAHHPALGNPHGLLFLVADGMGGHGAGDEASQIAVQTIVQVYYADDPETDVAIRLERAIKAAHLEISHASSYPGREKMGTTVVATVIKECKLWVAWVGDSRAYHFHRGELTQLTEDHSVLWPELKTIPWRELHHHPNRSKLTNSLTARRTEIEVSLKSSIDLQPGDQVLLCSDGLTSEIHDSQIQQVLRENSPRKSVERLIEAAKAPKTWLKDGQPTPAEGGEDNITSIVMMVAPDSSKKALPWVRLSLTAGALLLILAVLAGSLFWLELRGAPQDSGQTGTPESNLTSNLKFILGDASVTPTALPPTPPSLDTISPIPTETPKPTSTLAEFSTATPLLPTATPIPVTHPPDPTATFTSVASPTPNIQLLFPAPDNVFNQGQREIEFRWQYNHDCDLPESELGFEIRVAKLGGETQGVMDAVTEQNKITCNQGVRSYTVGNFQVAPTGGPAGKFQWEVVLIKIAPYQPEPLQASALGSFSLSSGSSGGGKEDGNGGGGGSPNVGQPK